MSGFSGSKTAYYKKTKETTRRKTILNDFKVNKLVYLMAVPMILFYIFFHYMPLYGAQIAFRDFSPGLGIWESPWVGFKYFERFFNDVYFTRILTNTLSISLQNILIGFPAPIIFALLLNEVRCNWFKRTIQTVTYLPHFISIMIICGLIVDFTSREGLISDILYFFGIPRQTMLQNPDLFQPIYVWSGVWQGVGWGSIIYLSALTNVDPQLYEAAIIDGAGKFKQTLHVTLPGIMPTITVMFILRIGQLMNLDQEKILLLYNPITYETADVISTYVYRKGLLEQSYSFSAAIGLFNSIINFILVISANKISKAVNETSLW